MEGYKSYSHWLATVESYFKNHTQREIMVGAESGYDVAYELYLRNTDPWEASNILIDEGYTKWRA